MTDLAEYRRCLSELLSPEQISDAVNDLEFYGRDYCKDFKPDPALILFPVSIDQVVAIIQRSSQFGVAIVPSGGRTGYSGGATAQAGQVVVSLERMKKILEINTQDRTLRCEAGATTEVVQSKAREAGLFFPVDFASRGSSQVGGNIATNAGGIRVVRYGPVRDWVLGLKVVTPGGILLDLNGPLYKNQTGYDLRSLFIGSEGTLGVIVEATLKLASPPAASSLALCGIADLQQAPGILAALRSKGLVINLFEYFDSHCLDFVLAHTKLRYPFEGKHNAYLIIEAETAFPAQRDGFEGYLCELIEARLVADVVIGQNLQQERELLALRESISDTIAQHAYAHKNDISVPISVIPKFVSALRELFTRQFAGARVLIFGHVGDGNLHLNVLKPDLQSEDEFNRQCFQADQQTFALVQRFSGSISAEHGVGLLKKPFLHYSRSRAEIQLMRQLKQLLDPQAIMNPGKIFD